MVRLTEVQRGQAIALLMEGQRQQQVARHFHHRTSLGDGLYKLEASDQIPIVQSVNLYVIVFRNKYCLNQRLVRRLRETGRVADRPRSGHPRVTSQRQDRAIRLAHLRNRHLTATVNTVGSDNRRIHPKTVRNRLREFGLRARRPNVGLPLNRTRHARRMAWVTAQAPRRFPMRQWRRVFFTDESRFTLFRADGRRRLYRRRGERFADACVFERDRYGGGSIMVWGGISHGVKSPLIVVPGNLTAVRYRDEILRPVAVPLVQQHQMTFQHDNARPHVARVCQDFLANNNIVPLDWPPYSPDLSPIEHLWDELDRRVRRRRNTPNTLWQLRTALLEEWENIPMRKINALVNSMQRRIRAVMNAMGTHQILTRCDFDFTIWGGGYLQSGFNC